MGGAQTKHDVDHGSIHGLFSSIAATRHSVALMSGAEVVTYPELAARGEAAHRALVAWGVRPGDRVALLADRSPAAIAAIIGVLRAGAAYVPIDPGLPAQVIDDILEDCAPKTVLADSCVRERAGPRAAAWRPIDDFGPDADGAELPAEIVNRNDPAYIMYTSGSTGRPKGVIVPHRGIVRLVRDQSFVSFTESETFLSLAPLAFDASTFEIWGALLNGGKLGIVAASQPSIADIAAAINNYRVTTLWLTAGLFHAIVDHALEALEGVRTVVAGGDIPSPTHASRVLEILPNTQLVNGYGPTENTTFTCCHRISDATWDRASALPIGRPINGTHVAIVDDNLAPVPSGAIGQLCTSGDGVALGYLNRPDLTSAKFRTNTVAGLPGDMVYLTGDLARQRGDGVVEFLGRADRQIKINGKRVELDGIEELLRADPRIIDAVACADTTTQTAAVVAFVTLADALPAPAAAELATTMLRDLSARAAREMTPAFLEPVDHFPLTSNGKVDRQALLAQWRASAVEEAPIPDASDLEGRLAAILRDIIGARAIDRDRNFFEMGATSLHLVRAHARIAKEMDPTLSLAEIFDNPRLALLARRLQSGAFASEGASDGRARGAQQSSALERLREQRRGQRK